MADSRAFYGISIVAVFSVFAATSLYYDPIHYFIDSYRLHPFLMIFGVVVGAATYALMAEKMEKKEDAFKQSTGMILKFLSGDERKVIERLLEGKGRALQSEITRLPDMSKLKSHRAVRRLSAKGIIVVEKTGKTNTVRLSEDVAKALF